MQPIPYLNTFPYPLVSWKGQTLNQITSSIISNGKVNKNIVLSSRSLMMSRPLKIYRREIAANIDTPKCSDRISSSIDVFDQPGGSIINSKATQQNGLVNTIDDIFPNNTCQRPGTCEPFLSDAKTALRRVRSSGMIKRQFDISTNNNSYHTNNKQYLISRNIAFEKNQYNYLREGNSSAKPGDSLSKDNVYSSNGTTECKVYYKPNNPQFASQGGVSSGEVTLRNKYNTIQTSAATMGSVYGNGVADALSYGVSENIYTNAYTMKDKKGYPLPKYPKFTKTGELRECDTKSIRG
jgi:hypothetical protein